MREYRYERYPDYYINNDCYKSITDLTTNSAAIAEVIQFVQANKEKLTMPSTQANGSIEYVGPNEYEDEDELQEK